MKQLSLVLALLVSASSCNNDVTGLGPPSDPATETFDPSLNVTIATMTKLPGGTYIRDLVIGTGDSVKATTDSVWVTYSGRLKDGKLFDSGTNRVMRPDEVVAGFRAGLIDMRVGGRRQLVIPSEQGFGPRSIRGSDGTISIPRQSTLVFDVQLLKLHTPSDSTGSTP
jgi:FKBP-type peptidyl-prolyl cis-trans isomerase